MAQLIENQQHIAPISEQLLAVLDDETGKRAVANLVQQWQVLDELQIAYQDYLDTGKTDIKADSDVDIDTSNQAQHCLRQTFEPFFESLHTGLKQLDKTVRQHEKAKAEAKQAKGKRGSTDRETKKLKEALGLLHKEVKISESYYKHIHWLQERFSKAEYEDVTGLCKLASQDEVKEQDYSLNPGRYVGVVIEEDGKTEEEFIENISLLNDELMSLNQEALVLSNIIQSNFDSLADS
jgi:type I restriction enzyme M protein